MAAASHGPTAHAWPEKLRFSPNVPQTIALRSTNGKPATSSIPGAPDQVLYVTTGGNAWYADLAIPRLLELHGIQPGEEFEVCMRQMRGKPAYWTLEPLRADTADRRLEEQLAGTLAVARAKPYETNDPEANETAWANRNNAARGGAPTSNVPAAPSVPALPDRQKPEPSQSLMRRLLVQAIDDIAAAEAHARSIGIEDFCFTGEDARALAITAFIESCKQGVRA